MPDIIVIFGAAIGANGQPGGTLRRRVEGACRFGAIFRDPVYLVTGGVGRHGPAEADVMRDLLLGYGVPASRILVEDKATDTLSSAVLCAAILKSRPERGMIHVCSSTYHIPRCRMLLAMLGLKTEAVPMRSDRKVLGTGKWLYYLLREAAALPYDAIVMAVKRPFL